MKTFVFLVLIGAACAAPSLYTPEVAAARAEFEDAYAAAALAAEQNVLPEVVHPEAVYQEYTPEVAAAREEFLAIYNTAYLAASEAIAKVKEAVTEDETEVETEAPEVEAELEAAVEETIEVVAEAAPVEEVVELAAEAAPIEEVVDLAAEAAPVEEVVELAAEDAPLEAPEPVQEVVEVAVEAAPLVAAELVTDTEEVALAEVDEAKAKFAIAVKAAADAADAAGDIDEDGSLSSFSGFISPLLTNTFPYGTYGVHAPVVYSAGTVVHATSPLTLKGPPLHFSYPFAPSFAFVKV